MSPSGFGYWVAKRVRRVRKVPKLSVSRSSLRKAFPNHGQTFSWGLRSRTRLVYRKAYAAPVFLAWSPREPVGTLGAPVGTGSGTRRL